MANFIIHSSMGGDVLLESNDSIEHGFGDSIARWSKKNKVKRDIKKERNAFKGALKDAMQENELFIDNNQITDRYGDGDYSYKLTLSGPNGVIKTWTADVDLD